REQFRFLRDNDISTAGNMTDYEAKAEETLAGLLKQRTILNVRKRKRQKLYTALADVEALARTQKLCAEGVPGLEDEAARYSEAVAVLEKSGIDRNKLRQEKAGLYDQLAEVNREIRDVRKKLKMCVEIQERLPIIKRDLQTTEPVQQKKKLRVQIK
ncbi:MAG: relaxase, partial [Oscillibacter sp.]|nr:relaxase [Oscillibacter sp.]